MAKKQESYELMTVFSLKNGEEAAKELVEKFREKIASSATLDEVNEWGKRKLAYPINDEPDGYLNNIFFQFLLLYFHYQKDSVYI